MGHTKQRYRKLSHNQLDDIISKKYHFKQFTKDTRSSFQYWYYHWKAFNVVAKELGCWKFKYLFHDIEKPWLKLFWKYDKVQSWHRTHNSHHTQYKGGLNKIDWEALIIDNECSRFTKLQAQMSAREYINYILNEKANVSDELKEIYKEKCFPILEKLGI